MGEDWFDVLTQDELYNQFNKAFQQIYRTNVDRARFDRTYQFVKLNQEFDKRWPTIPEYISIKLWGKLEPEAQESFLEGLQKELNEGKSDLDFGTDPICE
jgi:hypothetical protein